MRSLIAMLTCGMSALVGALMRIPLPSWARTPVLGVIAQILRIDVHLAARPLSEYPSFGALFVRDLTSGVRPIGSEFVSAIDGTLRGAGTIHEGWLEQIKGHRYSLAALLASDELAQRFQGGTYFNLYLSPRDYHHVHAPLGGTVRRLWHIPGALLPVNALSTRRIPGLFTLNERLIIEVEASRGSYLVVMVGATNVGRMRVPFHPIVTNTRSLPRGRPIALPLSPCAVEKGARIGTFELGSTVVLLCSAELGVAPLERVVPRAVCYGETLARTV